MKRIISSVLLSFLLAISWAAPLFDVSDKEWDDGSNLIITYRIPQEYDSIIIDRHSDNEEVTRVLESIEAEYSFVDSDLQHDKPYRYILMAYSTTLSDTLILESEASPIQQWFYMRKLGMFIVLLMICFAILYYINSARRGKDYYIRRISGLDSMEEAIGRATEKGKPILFVPGIADLEEIQTIASLTILSHLAFRAAEYNTEIIVPCRWSMVLSAAREVVKEAFMKAGKPDAYKEENIFYLTEDQFGYVAGVDGIMLREAPAANFFMGSFYAESLILAETGFSTGAIQTSGTANAHQLPFFVVSCDYTLIGEELFAASAYLSRDPQQLGSLKGHDFGKILVLSLIVAGVLFEILGYSGLREFLSTG